jgi:hypothetical protein
MPELWKTPRVGFARHLHLDSCAERLTGTTFTRTGSDEEAKEQEGGVRADTRGCAAPHGAQALPPVQPHGDGPLALPLPLTREAASIREKQNGIQRTKNALICCENGPFGLALSLTNQ